MKANFFEKIILEKLYFTANLKEQPVQVSEDFVILYGKVSREKQYNESKNILIYLDVSFYNKILNVVNENSDRNKIKFHSTTVDNFYHVDQKWYCKEGIIEVNFDKNGNCIIIN